MRGVTTSVRVTGIAVLAWLSTVVLSARLVINKLLWPASFNHPRGGVE